MAKFLTYLVSYTLAITALLPIVIALTRRPHKLRMEKIGCYTVIGSIFFWVFSWLLSTFAPEIADTTLATYLGQLLIIACYFVALTITQARVWASRFRCKISDTKSTTNPLEMDD